MFGESRWDYLKEYEAYVFTSLHKKYFVDDELYSIFLINNIIYNDKMHLVAKFKDYLIADDQSEFLKRFYKHRESFPRLDKIYEYYEKYSRIYPNYTILLESKYLYKNIHQKQKMIDLQQEKEEEIEKMKERKKKFKEKEYKKNEEKNIRSKNKNAKK